MVVKIKQSPIELIRQILRDHNGILFTSDLTKLRIPRTYLSILQKSGELQRISRGIYTASNIVFDDMAILQARFKVAIYSHETALFLLGLSDRNPLFYSMTVKTGYNATSLKSNNVKVYFIKKELYALGQIIMKTPFGNDIKTYNRERTICDLVRNRNQIDINFVNEALKKYVLDKNKNLNQLYEYANLLGIQKVIRESIEVLL